ncbi:MAG: tRNA (adenosine(37)-N6)-threonylcarbamoyltransferase complex dimerization subunit type 1 TsaB [Spirochaetia bacterium]
MNVLAIDTSTETLALAAQRGDSWASLCLRRGLQHSSGLLPLAEGLLKELGMNASDLELLVCARGPGSFTGIRIGLATAMGISYGRGIPLVGVATLDAIALPWAAYEGDVCAVLDARKGKYYAALFRGGALQGTYRDVSPVELAQLLAAADRPLLAGPDAPRIGAALGEAAPGKAARRVTCTDFFDPRSLLRIGVQHFGEKGADPSSLQPLYLRKSEAEIASGL